MATVAPTAANAGFSIEKTTALIGILADAGLDSSTVGTGLRNVFLDIAKEGLTLDEALNKIATATDSNVAAMDLFGKRGATVGAVLANNRDRVSDLNDVLVDSAGFAAEAAGTIEGDFKGSLDTLKSATENLQITFVEFLEVGVTPIIKGLTSLVRGLSTFIESLKQVPAFIRENELTIKALIVAIIAFNGCLLYTSPSPRDATLSRMPSSA